eukprot:30011-Chlamydomonas_euryale.AAC.4
MEGQRVPVHGAGHFGIQSGKLLAWSRVQVPQEYALYAPSGVPKMISFDQHTEGMNGCQKACLLQQVDNIHSSSRLPDLPPSTLWVPSDHDMDQHGAPADGLLLGEDPNALDGCRHAKAAAAAMRSEPPGTRVDGAVAASRSSRRAHAGDPVGSSWRQDCAAGGRTAQLTGST